MTCLLLLSLFPATGAQTPQTQAQKDAASPPGTTVQRDLPPEVRQNTLDPTRPPGTQSQPQQAQPQVSSSPSAEQVQSSSRPSNSSQTPDDRGNSSGSQSKLDQARPVPPLPVLTRTGVNAGEPLQLSLADAIRRALENNNDVEMARNDVRLAESYLRSLQSEYDPVFQFGPQINRSVSPQTSLLSGTGASGRTSRTEIDFSSSMFKRWSTGGGQYQFFFNNSRITSDSTLNSFSPIYSSSLGVTFTQPLLRDRAIDQTRRNIRIQRKRLEQSDADFRRLTIEVIAQVQRAYWELIFALRNSQNQMANLNLARENFRRTEAGVVMGAAAPLDRAEVQTELSNREAALLLASQNVTLAENNLKALILRDPQAREWSSALIPTDELTFDVMPINLQDVLAEARLNRPELRRLHLQQEINDIDVRYFRNQARPRLDLQMTVSATGLAGSPAVGDSLTSSQSSSGVAPGLVGGYGQMLKNLAGMRTHNIVGGFTVEIPLHNRQAVENLASASIEREQLAAAQRNQEQTIELEVRNATEVVETSRRRVLAARSARENAEVQLNGERRLYEVGRSTMFLLFQRENQLVTARSQELRAETDYNKALVELQRAASTTLSANHVIIETPSGR